MRRPGRAGSTRSTAAPGTWPSGSPVTLRGPESSYLMTKGPRKEHAMRPMRWAAGRYARLRYGKMPEPLTKWAEHGGVFWAWSTEESMVEATWRSLPRGLRDLAVLKSASSIDCPWCLDFGSHVGEKGGLDPAKVQDLHRWRESSAYDEL